MRYYLLLLLFVLPATGPLCAQPDTVSVYFPFNVDVLTEGIQLRLDSLIYSGALSASETLQIIGYADAVGGNAFNLDLSRQRANAVKSYLLQSGFSGARITLITGKGEHGALAERPGGNLADRRVDIVKLRGMPAVKKSDVTVFKLKPMEKGNPKSSVASKLSVDFSNVSPGQILVIENIYFYAGRHFVRNESYPALDALVAALTEHPEIKIRVEGHVCCVPVTASDAIDDDTGHEELSINRAEIIRKYLIEHGISKDRLSYMGFGHRHPLVFPEKDEADANRNRRVEVRIMP